jgi:hypothetical protein
MKNNKLAIGLASTGFWLLWVVDALAGTGVVYGI